MKCRSNGILILLTSEQLTFEIKRRQAGGDAGGRRHASATEASLPLRLTWMVCIGFVEYNQLNPHAPKQLGPGEDKHGSVLSNFTENATSVHHAV